MTYSDFQCITTYGKNLDELAMGEDGKRETKMVSFRMEVELAAWIEALARRQDRTFSGQVQRMLKQWIEDNDVSEEARALAKQLHAARQAFIREDRRRAPASKMSELRNASYVCWQDFEAYLRKHPKTAANSERYYHELVLADH